MTLLRRRVPFAPGEALVGFASRLAACNGVGLSEFCRDLGLALRGLLRGGPGAVQRLAALSGEAPVTLEAGVVTYVAPARHSIRGEWFQGHGLRRRSLVVCPLCLAEDVGRGGLPPAELASARVAWCVGGIETCPTHRVALQLLEGELQGDDGHDFSHRLAPHLPALRRMADEAIRREPTAFELYASDRLDGAARGSPLLDAMPFYAARSTCLRLGILVDSGPRTTPSALGPEACRAAEAVGFEVLRDGEAGLLRELEARQSKALAGRKGHEGPQAAFGTFWQWLTWVRDDPAYAAVTGPAAEHAFGSYPLADGARVLGTTLERRRHTLIIRL